MTFLVGGSVLLIAASAIALFFGWIAATETLIWFSIAASVAAAVMLALAYHRSREEPSEDFQGSPAPPQRRGPSDRGEPPRDRLAPAAGEPPGERTAPTDATRPSAGSWYTPSPAPAAPLEPAVPAPGPPRSERTPPSPAAPARPAGPAEADEVVGVPDRRRFHRPDCRYATARGAQPMSRATARRRGYNACSICKP